MTPVAQRFACIATISVVALTHSIFLHAQTLPQCSLSKTNTDCQITIDRSNPVAPPAVQMFSDRELTVVIKNPLPFERYFLDFSTGAATLSPDVTSAIVTALSGNLAKLTQLKLPTPLEDRVANFEGKKQIPPCDDLHLSDTTWPGRDAVTSNESAFKACFKQLAKSALPLYRELEPLVAPDALTSAPVQQEPDYYFLYRRKILNDIDAYLQLETSVSDKITLMTKAPYGPQPASCTPSSLNCPTPVPVTYSTSDEVVITELADYQKLIDAVSADLAGYDQRIHDIGPCGYSDAEILPEKRCAWQKTATYGLQDLVKHKDQYYLSIAAPTVGTPPDQELTSWLAVSLPDVIFAGAFSQERQQAPSPYVPGNFVLFNERYWLCAKNCNQNPPINPNWIAATAGAHKPIDPVVIASRRDNSTIYQNMVTRTITYSLDSLNLVSYSQQTAPAATNKKAIAAIAISFADRPNQRAGIPTGVPPTAFRWEASAGVFFSWLPNRSFTLSSTGAVIDSKTRPTPVPFAAANYRLTGDFGKRWKQNLYLTGAIGVNANNTTGEFGAGGSYAWRGLMVSLLGHFGHDLRPTSYTPGGSGTLPTVSHWTVNPAIGISVRVPSLTGR